VGGWVGGVFFFFFLRKDDCGGMDGPNSGLVYLAHWI